jgi:hypothetical protein
LLSAERKNCHDSLTAVEIKQLLYLLEFSHARVAGLWSDFEHLRDSLVSAVDSFDAAVGSLESRVLPYGEPILRGLATGGVSNIPVACCRERRPKL